MSVLLLALASAAICPNIQGRLEYEACLGREQERLEVELNSQWRKTLQEMRRHDVENKGQSNADASRALLTSQRAWLRYREVECEMVVATMQGYSGEPEAEVQCLIKVTRRRIQILRGRAGSFSAMLEAL